VILERNPMFPYIQFITDNSSLSKEITTTASGIPTPEITIEQVLLAQGSYPEVLLKRKPELKQLTRQAIETVLQQAEPQVFIAARSITRIDHRYIHLGDSLRLEGETMDRALRPAEGVIAVISTIGSRVDNCIRETFQSDPALALAMDTAASCCIDRIGSVVCQASEQVMQRSNRNTGVPISPGTPDWDVANGQQQVFSLFAGISLSISLNAAGMMSPLKSISMLIPYGTHLDQTSKPCDFCNMNSTCTFRQRP
jgi:hypothetical protein